MRKERTTKEILLEKGLELFSENGYEATTTRKIAEKCGVNVATVSFHFGCKEGFYIAVMNYAAEIMEAHFKPFYSKAANYLSGNTYKEQTWAYIDEFFDLLISIMSDRKRRTILYLLIREETNPPDGGRPLSLIVYNQSEKLLVDLIRDLCPELDATRLGILCRLIVGGLVSQAEHPSLLQQHLQAAKANGIKSGEADLRRVNKQFALSAVWQAVNKESRCPFLPN